MKSKLLIIDDDMTLVDALGRYLRMAGYEVITAPDGLAGLQLLNQYRPDLVILDVMMPKLDGWETCKRIREVSSVPIIMLTARGQESDSTTGQHLGANDYITKPFSLKELEARAKALLLRPPTPNGSEVGALYSDDHLVIDPVHGTVTVKGQPIELTATERKLLFLLVKNAGQALSPNDILEQVWGREYVNETEFVNLYVWRLRQKIEIDPRNPRYILGERDQGYHFAKPFDSVSS